MGDADNNLPSLKKRTAERQITKENFGLDDDEDTSGQDTGTFRRASDDVLAQRRIVKVRRPSGAPSAASNPFAGIRLFPPTTLNATPVALSSADENVKSVSDDIGQKNGGNQDIDKLKDDSDKKSESKVEEAGTESTVEKERTKTEGKVEDDKKVQSSAGEPATEVTIEDERTKTEGKVDDDKKMQSSAGEPEMGKDSTVAETRKPESTDVKTKEVDESKNEAKMEANDKKSENEERNSGEGVDKQKDGATPFSSFQQLSSSQNAFTGVAGSGFSSSTFSFGPISNDGSFVNSGFSKSTLFSSLGSSVANRGEGSGIMQEVTVEDERTKTEGKVDDDKKMQSSAGEPETGKDSTVTETRKPESTDVKTKEVDESKNEAKTEANDKKSENEESNSGEGVDKQKDGATPFSSFQQLSSSQNAFTGVAGSGFSSSTFSFGPISNDGSFVNSGFSKSTLFSSLGSSVANRGEGSGIMQEVTVETGEENEKAVFTADSVLFEFLDGGWKERGKGEIKVNVSTVGTGKARLVMRARGNYRLILNASLYSGMKLTAMEKKGVTFACMNSNGEEKKNDLSTFALKFKDTSIVEEFRTVVTEHTCKTATGLKTPENSP